jgi:hypothetical protein
MTRKTRPIGALILVLAATLTVGVVAEPAWADDYPTWADVEAARHNEAAKKAEIAKIEALLAGLDTEAAAYAKAALEAAETYNQALDALAEAKLKAATLQDRADVAQATAERSNTEAAILVTQLARSGGSDFTVELLTTDQQSADALLYKIGAMNKLTEQAETVYQQAVIDLTLSTALCSKAEAARAVRSELADAAA